MITFFRRRKAASVTPEGIAPAAPDTAVVMQFRTQGAAVVEVRQQERRLNTRPGSSVELLPNNETWLSNGFGWRCLGCDQDGSQWEYGTGASHFERIAEARTAANEHAATCHALPKPDAA